MAVDRAFIAPSATAESQSRPPVGFQTALVRGHSLDLAGAAWRFLPDEYPSPSTDQPEDTLRIGWNCAHGTLFSVYLVGTILSCALMLRPAI